MSDCFMILFFGFSTNPANCIASCIADDFTDLQAHYCSYSWRGMMATGPPFPKPMSYDTPTLTTSFSPVDDNGFSSSSLCKLPILSIKLKYPGLFFTTLRFHSFHFILFLWKNNSLMCLGFQKEKTSKKRSVYNHGDTCLFHKATFIRWISLETNMSPLISEILACLAFLSILFILTIKIFNASPQTFHSSVLFSEELWGML